MRVMFVLLQLAKGFSVNCANPSRKPSTVGGNFWYAAVKMAVGCPEDISALLVAWNQGNEGALSALIPLVYEDLRGIARRYLNRRSPGYIPSSGTLAHEAYLRLAHVRGFRCQNRAHFFAFCSQMIRRILVDHARRQRVAKRGGGAVHVPLDEVVLGSKVRGIELEALDEALSSLAGIDARKARVVELRFFGGLSVEETAEVLEISEETVTRDWRVAKTWLYRELARTRA